MLISIQKKPGHFSVDIRPLDKDGLVSPCGNCRLFRFASDALIWIKEETHKEIPAYWPNIETWDFSKDYNRTL